MGKWIFGILAAVVPTLLIGGAIYAQSLGGNYGLVQSGVSGSDPLSARTNTTPQFDAGTVASSVFKIDSSATPSVSVSSSSFKMGYAASTVWWAPTNGRIAYTTNNGGAGILQDFQTNGKLLTMEPTRGASVAIHTGNEQALTFAGGAGNASLTATGLCPAKKFIIGVSGRWTTTATTCTSADIGDGTDVDMYADNLAVTANTTFDEAQATATSRLYVYQAAASDVVVTGVGGNCVSGVIRLTCHYLDYDAAIAN